MVSSLVVLVASMIADRTQSIFRRNLPRRLGSQWVGCISVSDAVGLATRLRIETRTGVSRAIATFAVTMDTLPVVAVYAVANPVVPLAVTRTPTWSPLRPPATPLPLPPPLLPAVLWMPMATSRRILSATPALLRRSTATAAARGSLWRLLGGPQSNRRRRRRMRGE